MAINLLIIISLAISGAGFLWYFNKKDIICLFYLGQSGYLATGLIPLINSSSEALLEGLIIVIIGTLLTIFLHLVFKALFKNKISKLPLEIDIADNSYILVGLSIVGLAILTVVSTGKIDFRNWYNHPGLSFRPLASLFNFLILLSLPLAICFFRQKKIFWVMLMLSCAFLGLLMTGSRLIFLAFWAIPFYYLLKLNTPLFKKIILVSLIMLGMLGSHLLARAIRWTPKANEISRVLQHSVSVDPTGGEGSIIGYYQLMIQYFHEKGEIGPKTLQRILFAYVPRFGSLKSIKPEDISYTAWDYALDQGAFGSDSETYKNLRSEGLRGSIHGLYWGDAIFNLGYLGILINAILLSLVAMLVTRFLEAVKGESAQAMVFCLVWLMMFCFARGSVSNGFNLFAYGLPLLILYNFAWTFLSNKLTK